MSGLTEDDDWEGFPPSKDDPDDIHVVDTHSIMQQCCTVYYQHLFEIIGMASARRPLRQAALNAYREEYQRQLTDSNGLALAPSEVERALNYLVADCLMWVALPGEVRDQSPADYAENMCAGLQYHLSNLTEIRNQARQAYEVKQEQVGYDTGNLSKASAYFDHLDRTVTALHNVMERILERGNIVIPFTDQPIGHSVIGKHIEMNKWQVHVMALHGMLSMSDEAIPVLETFAHAQFGEEQGKCFSQALRSINEAVITYAKGDSRHELRDKARLYETIAAHHASIEGMLEVMASLPKAEIALPDSQKSFANMMAELIHANLSGYLTHYRDKETGQNR